MSVAALRSAHLVRTLVLVALSLVVCPTLIAADNDVVKVEEHWELQVGGPDVARSAPQVTMIMSPISNLTGAFFSFILNHGSLPEFTAGGYQLQRWHGEECVDAVGGAWASPLNNDGEVITWVQRQIGRAHV